MQEQIQLQHKEIIRGLLANENVSNIIKEAISILRNNRGDLSNNPILNLTDNQLESIEYNDLRFIVNELSNPATYLQPSGLYSKDLFNKVASIVNILYSKRLSLSSFTAIKKLPYLCKGI